MRNLILSIFSTLSLGFVVAGAQPQNPIPGTYFIVNRVLSPDGSNLTLTLQGEGEYAIVTPLNGAEAQRWIISDLNPNGTQAVTPVTAQGFQAGGTNTVTVLPQDGFVWTIRNTTGGYYTIEDPVTYLLWVLDSAVNGSNIAIKAGTGSPTQDWVLDLIKF